MLWSAPAPRSRYPHELRVCSAPLAADVRRQVPAIHARRRLALTCLLPILVTLAACTAPPQPAAGASGTTVPTPGITPAPTPTVDELITDDWARLEEVWHLLEQAGPGVWAGWGTNLPPLLLESETADFLVGHASPPAGFAGIPGLTVADRQVYGRVGHLAASIGVQQIGDRLGVVLLPRDRLQTLLDEALGPGVVVLDDVQYVRWAAHEAFHVHELTSMSGDLPRFDFEGDEMELVAALASTEGFAERLADEGRLLMQALATQTDAELQKAVARFFAARAQRRAVLPPEVGGFEQAVEWTEGLARYSDVRLLQAAASGYQPSPPFAALGMHYPEPDVTWADAIRWLDDLSSIPGTVRDRYYELGAAQAHLLDRLMPGWHTRALPGGESLEALLQAGLAAADADTPTVLRALAVVDLAVAGRDYRVAVADDPEAWARGLAGVHDLGPLDGLLFAFPAPTAAEFFMKNAAMALDIAFFDAAGACVRVVTMPLCANDPCPAYGAPSPYRWALEAPAGTLAGLAPGDRMTVPTD